MTRKGARPHDAGRATVYRIRIQGHLGPQWTEWFDGVSLTLEDDGEATLTATVADQAALYGLLKKVFALGIPLLAVHRVRE